MTTAQSSWYQAIWFRIIIAIVAIGLLAYGLVMPLALAFLGIGSRPCLEGSQCATFQTIIVSGVVAGLLTAVTGFVLLVIFVFRPRSGLLIAGVVLALACVAATLGQMWGISQLSENRLRGDDAIQLSYKIDQAMQETIVSAIGRSIWDDPSITGPETSAVECTTSGGQAGYQASSTLTFGKPDAAEQAAIEDVWASHPNVRFLILASVALDSEWASQSDGSMDWTVTSACQPFASAS